MTLMFYNQIIRNNMIKWHNYGTLCHSVENVGRKLMPHGIIARIAAHNSRLKGSHLY